MRKSLVLVAGALVALGTSACIAPGGNPPGSSLYQRELEEGSERTNDGDAIAEVFLVGNGLAGIKGELIDDPDGPDVDTWRVLVPNGGSLFVDCGDVSSPDIRVEIFSGDGTYLENVSCEVQDLSDTASSPTGAYLLRITTAGGNAGYELLVSQAFD